MDAENKDFIELIMAKPIGIEIRTKPYIKAFLINQFGEKPIMNNGSHIGSKFCGLLSHREDDTGEKPNLRFKDQVKLYVSYHTFSHAGFIMDYNNQRNFNLYVEHLIKIRFRFYMDFKIELDPSFMNNLPYVREQLGIDMDAWDSDSIKKDYYRYRLKTGKSLLYKK